jgi:hypothetical protein
VAEGLLTVRGEGEARWLPWPGLLGTALERFGDGAAAYDTADDGERWSTGLRIGGRPTSVGGLKPWYAPLLSYSR